MRLLISTMVCLVVLSSVSVRGAEQIPVAVYVDEEEVTTDPVWQRRLGDRVRNASAIFKRHADIEFVPTQFHRWSSNPKIQDFPRSLMEFETQVKPPRGGIAIGFSSQYQFRLGRNNLGGTHGAMRAHILIRENAPAVYEPERLEVLVHELGHFLGATHSSSPDSAMRPVVGDGRARSRGFQIDLDPINARIVRLVGRDIRDRDVRAFHALSPTTLAELLPLYKKLQTELPDDPSTNRYVQMVTAMISP
jgi:Matrixin